MYCIAILTDQEQEGQNCAEYIRNYCTEKKVFPLIEIYQNQEQFFGRIRGSLTVGYQKKVPAGRIKPAFFVSNFWFLSIVFYCNVL